MFRAFHKHVTYSNGFWSVHLFPCSPSSVRSAQTVSKQGTGLRISTSVFNHPFTVVTSFQTIKKVATFQQTTNNKPVTPLQAVCCWKRGENMMLLFSSRVLPLWFTDFVAWYTLCCSLWRQTADNITWKSSFSYCKNGTRTWVPAFGDVIRCLLENRRILWRQPYCVHVS